MSDNTHIDPREFRNALGRFASGVTVVTTELDGQIYGMTANAFISVSLDPPLVLVSVDKRATLNKMLPVSKRYGVNILAQDQQDLSDHFARRPVEGLKLAFTTAPENYWAPLLWMSFMADMELSGGKPWSCHLTSCWTNMKMLPL